MAASTPTRDRILDAAMELFGENGFRATSITQIEVAAGLTPGAGGIYHHFRTKQALLEAGLARHRDRRRAIDDIRRIMVGLGDLRAELLLLGRYVLTELDQERALLRILAIESASRPDLVSGVLDQLRASYTGFAEWLAAEAGLPPGTGDALSAVGIGALLSHRLVPILFGAPATDVDDEKFLQTWVTMILNAVRGQ